MTQALVFNRGGWPRKTPYSAPENEFSPDLLKEGFNCLDRCPHGDHPVFIRGERMENGFPWLPFGGRAATSAAANLRKNPTISRDRDGSPIRLFHEGSDQELPDPKGAR
jgi:hypothetical protein